MKSRPHGLVQKDRFAGWTLKRAILSAKKKLPHKRPIIKFIFQNLKYLSWEHGGERKESAFIKRI
jgi:hypothetical protein